MVQDFKPFKKVMTKVKGAAIDSAYEVYMALYHQLVSNEEGKEDPFTQVQPSFFDLIIVDECHRGSAKDDSAWRKVLEYFSSATQIGMTATPKPKLEQIILIILATQSTFTHCFKAFKTVSLHHIVLQTVLLALTCKGTLQMMMRRTC